ncbi:MAG: hypothetical protein JW982_14555 [Spirochaetes bacterium]|nr:hypothetical protein [Spirochaetota bacterium]
MKICVCVNPVPDFGENCILNDGIPDYDGINYYIDRFDMAAYQTALKLKKSHGFAVTVLAPENPLNEKCLKRIWALGADRCVWLKTVSDSINNIASVMSSYLKVNRYDLVLTGSYSSNFSTGGFGALLAENSDIPVISDVISVDFSTDGKYFVIRKKIQDHTVEEYKTDAKFLASVCAAENVINYPSAFNLLNCENHSIDFIEDITSSAECINCMPCSFHDISSDIAAALVEGTEGELALKLIKLIEKKELLLK